MAASVLSMNLKMVSLISNGLRNLGSWPVSRSERNKGLSMNRKVGRAVLCAPTPAITPSLGAKDGAHEVTRAASANQLMSAVRHRRWKSKLPTGGLALNLQPS